MSIDLIQDAKTWWGANINKHPAWQTEYLPELKFKDILLSLNLAYEIRRNTIVLGKPNTELTTLIHSYFWEIVSCVLNPYTPYAITGIAAIHLHLGDESIPNKIDALTQSSSIQIPIHDTSLLTIEKNPDFFQPLHLKKIITKKNYLLTVESPESLLLRLRPQYLRDYPQLVSGFIKSISFNLEALQELLLQKSRPVLYLRLATLCEQVGKLTEAKLFRNHLKATTNYKIPGKTQILQHALPASIALPKSISDPAYIIRFRDQLRVYADQITHHFKDINIPLWDIKKIQEHAEETKKYDTYHSSTIEGYRVTEEEIQQLIEGREMMTANSDRETIERKMALKGYLEAHQYVTTMIEKHFTNHHALTELTIREIYASLFHPTLEAGLIKKEQLVQYRNDAVFIRHSRHIPPNHVKIDNLMRCLVEEINEIKDHLVTQAILAHYGFVTIHPYFDGNGRVSRLLMNYLLCRAGIPWITIRAEDRDVYFKALETAQCDENVLLFIQFMKKYFIDNS